MQISAQLYTDVSWETPAEIAAAGTSTWNRIHIYRSTNENSNYEMVLAATGTARTVTFDTASGTVLLDAHGYTAGSTVIFSSTGTLPASLSAGVPYYVVSPTTDAFKVASVYGGTALTFATAGSGTHSVTTSTLSDISSGSGATWVTTWQDTAIPITSSSAYFYIVRYYNSAAQTESKFYLTVKSMTPKEQRFVNHVRNIVTSWAGTTLGDDDLRAGILFGLQALNIQPPATEFSLDSIPVGLEPLLLVGAASFTLMYHYLGIAFTDLSYSDNGLSLTVDRGSKVQLAIDKLMKYYNDLIVIAKLEYSYGGSVVGTVQLPVSLNLGRNTMDVLNVFSAVGR